MPSITGLSLGILGYTHVGYPVLVALLARLSPNRVRVNPDYEPMVSVCIPAHNAAAHLQQKLASLAEQSYPGDKLEILVYSDGSTDGTEEIVRGFARQDPRVRLLRGEVCRGKPTGAQPHARRGPGRGAGADRRAPAAGARRRPCAGRGPE